MQLWYPKIFAQTLEHEQARDKVTVLMQNNPVLYEQIKYNLYFGFKFILEDTPENDILDDNIRLILFTHALGIQKYDTDVSIYLEELKNCFLDPQGKVFLGNPENLGLLNAIAGKSADLLRTNIDLRDFYNSTTNFILTVKKSTKNYQAVLIRMLEFEGVPLYFLKKAKSQ